MKNRIGNLYQLFQGAKNHRKVKSSVVTKVGLSVLLSLSATAYGAATDLANAPIPVLANSTLVRPNIMYTLDNSGSMGWLFMPDDVYFSGNESKNCFKNNFYNRIYYDPTFTYKPGVDSTGTSKGNATFTAAWRDAYGATSTGTTNLSASFTGGYSDAAQAAYYYKYSGGAPAVPVAGTCYANGSYTKITVSATSGPGATDERQNFANWYSYYRTRINTAKTALGVAFSTLNANYRVGFSTINNNSGSSTAFTNLSGDNFINIQDFTAANKTTWFSMLYSIEPQGGTPLQEALRKAGEYFKTGSMGYTGAASTDPVQYSCQQNFTILTTDGYWNSNSVTTIGNQDKTVIPTLPVRADTGLVDPALGLTTGTAWPKPFLEDTATPTSNTLADVAMYYWINDLRTTGTLAPNDVPTNTSDPAYWQHMVTYTIGLGLNGTLSFPSDLAALQKPTGATGEKKWPTPVEDTSTTIDDLWHAAINGHGQYFSAKDPDQLATSLIGALNDIGGRTLSFSANAVGNPNISIDNTTYSSSFNPANWSGEIKAYTINAATGAVNTTPTWSAQALLDARSGKNPVTGAEFDTRKIATYSGTAGIPFQWSSLTTTQKAGLVNTPYILQYLRGWRGNDGILYRKRQHLLGDIVNASGVVVGVPLYHYTDAGYITGPSNFVSTVSGRAKTLYQGSNDGMLHALDATTGSLTIGEEQWAYIPNLLMGKLKNLSLLTGFIHDYYVDGTPVVADVEFKNTAGGTGPVNWRTILVGGLGKGGSGYYALDVTDPTAASESSVAAKVLWEFTDPDMGFTYGKPSMVKTRAKGWVVLVTSGYNNVPAASGGPAGSTAGTGLGYLYVLNAKTGACIAKISTGSGSVTSPSGLAQIAPFVDNTDLDNTVDLVYAGDLNGDVWRFDLSDSASNPTCASPSTWSVSKFATLKDASNNPQPSTATPETAYIVLGGVKKRMVYVGTGKYLGVSDVAATTTTQSIYGIKDSGDLKSNSGTAAATLSVRGSTWVGQTMTVSGTTRTATYNPVNLSTKDGWYLDLPLSGSGTPAGTGGERANTDPQLAYGILTFITNIPDSSPCSIYGGSSWLNYIDYKTGGAIKLSTGLYSPGGKYLGKFISSGGTVIVAGGNPFTTFQGSDGNINTTLLPPPGASKRVSWRELVSP